MFNTNAMRYDFLVRAKQSLETTIQKLTNARYDLSINRYFTLVEAAAEYGVHLAYLQAARGVRDILVNLIKAILPEFVASEVSDEELLAVYYLLVTQCAYHYDLDCLSNLGSGYPTLPALHPPATWDSPRARIEAAVRRQMIKVIRSTIPDFLDSFNSRTLWLGAPFFYDRQAAAQYAIDRSRANFDNFPTDGTRMGLTEGFYGSVGSNRNYSRILSHRGASTGSAIFISECIHDGGQLPMTLHPADPTVCDENGSIGTYEQKGWRICSAQENHTTYGSATPNWRDHNGVKRYFASDTRYKVIAPDLVSTAVHFDDTAGTGLAGKIRDGGRDILAALFDTTDLETSVKLGDYIFVKLTGSADSPPSDHGFLIVGWGPVLNTLESLNITPSPTRSADNPIPYVSDFCFGTGEHPNEENTGWLQDPRPRPFYCSAVLINEDGLIGYTLEQKNKFKERKFQPFKASPSNPIRPNWDFYRIPDYMTVSYNRFYDEQVN